jgi:hypothetical protein
MLLTNKWTINKQRKHIHRDRDKPTVLYHTTNCHLSPTTCELSETHSPAAGAERESVKRDMQRDMYACHTFRHSADFSFINLLVLRGVRNASVTRARDGVCCLLQRKL